MEKKRKSVDLQTKLDIIHICETSQLTKSQVSRRYGMSSSTLFTILKNKEVIKAAVLRDNTSVKRKKVRGAQHRELEVALYKWYSEKRLESQIITGPMLKAKADELSIHLNLAQFKCSDGWLNRFKIRKGITLRQNNNNNNNNSVDLKESLTSDWSPYLNERLGRYQTQDIYNVMETALFYNLTPDKTLDVINVECRNGERSDDRITILLCTNMNGSDKCIPYVIGNTNSAPNVSCDYDRNTKSWMTLNLFQKWLQQIDTKFRSENRRIALVLNDCSIHPAVELNNIELLFLPANCTRMFQQSVVKQFKHNFRRMFLGHLVVNDEDESQPKILRMVAESWQQITPERIVNDFKYADFTSGADGIKSNRKTQAHDSNLNLEEPPEWNTIAEQMAVTSTYYDYVSVDDNVCTYNQLDEQMKEEKETSDGGGETLPSELEIMKALEVMNMLIKNCETTREELTAFQTVQEFMLRKMEKKN